MSVRRRSRASSRPSIVEIEVPVDPNTFTWPERSRKKFVQLVALQCLVTPAPITNEYPIALESLDRGVKRKLPQKTEREIADHFAFLAAGDGSGAACCIEEGEGSLRFRLAMNEGVPVPVLEGLKAVLREVRKVATGDQIESEIKAAVWANVLDLERTKVHADLIERFSRAPRPLSEQFEDALGYRDNGSSDKLTDEEARMVLQKIFDLCTRVTTSDKDRCTRDLDRLLDTCYRFRGSRSFKNFLKAVHSRRQLVQMIEKLGRYKTASNALVIASKKFPDLFINIDVEAVPTLPALDAKAAAGFKGIYIGDVAQDLTHNTETMCMSRLRTITDLSNEKLSIKYQDLCQTTPTAHAEIQLVKFYEENPDIDRPSFIGCSKKSCFLCGLFLQLQRRFTVSKAHQNIYHTWTVPSIRCATPENAVMLDFVVDKMSRIIEDSCKKMLWEKPDDSNLHKSLIASPPMSPGFPTPRSPLSPVSPGFSRPGTAASGIYTNLQNIRAAVKQLPLPHVSSKITDSSGDSTTPEPSSPNLSATSSCTSVSDNSSPVDSRAAKRQQLRQKQAVEASATVERMPTIMAADAPPLPQRSASRQAKESPVRPGSARSVRKRGSPVEVPKAQPTITNEPVSSFTRSQSVRVSRRTAPSPTPKAPARSASVARKTMATPEIPPRGGRVRSSSVMGTTRKVGAASDAESVSPNTVSHPFGPLRRANTAPTETTKSAIPVPRSVSRSNRKATPTSPPRSPSVGRPVQIKSSHRKTERPPSPGHITNSLRHGSPISVARFETAMAMAVTSVTGSPTMVELPAFKGAVDTPSTRSVQNTPKSTDNEVPTGKKAHKNTSTPVIEKTVETVSTAGLGLKRSSRVSLKDSFVSATSNQAVSTTEVHPQIDSMTGQAEVSPLVDSSEESAIPKPKRSLSERRGRPLKRVEPGPTGKRTANEERKRAAIDRATADAAATVQENGFEAQRKRGMTIADVVQQSGFQAQINRGMSVKRRQIPEPTNFPHTVPKNYYSDTEMLKTKLRGGALSTISSASNRSRLPRMSNPAETEYTLYLAGPDHDDKTLGEKIFTGKLSDGNAGGELKQRVGCRLRTALRPAEKEITGMRVKEVAKSLEEMVLDIFFPDAVLRLEVMWDGHF